MILIDITSQMTCNIQSEWFNWGIISCAMLKYVYDINYWVSSTLELFSRTTGTEQWSNIHEMLPCICCYKHNNFLLCQHSCSCPSTLELPGSNYQFTLRYRVFFGFIAEWFLQRNLWFVQTQDQSSKIWKRTSE